MAIPIAMMATTHGFVALALAVALLPDAPGEAAPGVVLAAAFLGGVAPDLDLLADRRKTLHFPVVGSALAAAVIAVAVLTGSGEAVVAGTVLGIGIDSTPDPGRPLDSTVEAICRQGGVAVVPHPFQRSRHGVAGRHIGDVDGIEIGRAHV